MVRRRCQRHMVEGTRLRLGPAGGVTLQLPAGEGQVLGGEAECSRQQPPKAQGPPAPPPVRW